MFVSSFRDYYEIKSTTAPHPAAVYIYLSRCGHAKTTDEIMNEIRRQISIAAIRIFSVLKRLWLEFTVYKYAYMVLYHYAYVLIKKEKNK